MNRTGWTPIRTAIVIALGANLALLAALPDAHAASPGQCTFARGGQPLPPASPRAQADEAFRLQRHAEAYGRYAALADEGDAASAGMALMLVINGAALFGAQWSATPGQLERWSALMLRDAAQLRPQLSMHDRGE